MMPDIAGRIGIARALGVPFPFGHPLGHAGDEKEHRVVIERALEVVRVAEGPGTIFHLDAEWPDPDGDWHKRWQPREPSPIIAALRGRSR